MAEQHGADAAPASLWRNRDFARLWFAQIISNAGTAVTGLALPLTAILVLHAGPGQMSLLRIASFAPNLLLGQLLWASAALIPLVGAGLLIASLGGALWGVAQMSLRQAITPPHLFARATAARRLPMFGMQIAGAALGGLLGGTFGLRPTLLLGGPGLVAAFLHLARSPIPGIRDLDAASDGPAGG